MATHIRRLLTANGAQPAPAPTSAITVEIPNPFSCVERPDDVIQAVRTVAVAVESGSLKSIVFDHSKMVDYDLAAEAVLDVVAREVVRERRRRYRRSVELRGMFPSDANASRFIRGIGISRHLQVEDVQLSREERAKLLVFEKHRRSGPPPGGIPYSTYKGQVVQEFVDHINQCLGTVKLALTAVGRLRLCEYTGEVIDNVDQHAGSNHWFVAGYLDTSLSPPMCEVAIFNFGRTFAESFQSLPPDSFAWSQVQPYLDAHRNRGWFTPGSWTEDDLLTLVSLQGGISSKSIGQDDIRGQGSTDLIRYFQDVHAACDDQALSPQMAIVSGATHIIFDGTYRLGMDTNGRWTIAFNSENLLSKPPDRKFVRHMNGVFFPGTIVSIRFAVQQTGAAPTAAKS